MDLASPAVSGTSVYANGLMSHITVVSIVNKLWSGWLGLKSWQEQMTFISSITSELVLGPTRFPVHWVPGSPSHSAEVASV